MKTGSALEDFFHESDNAKFYRQLAENYDSARDTVRLKALGIEKVRKGQHDLVYNYKGAIVVVNKPGYGSLLEVSVDTQEKADRAMSIFQFATGIQLKFTGEKE
jgi:hypothetical protein